MKFTGLILICATSCLALILPAIGVVHFPKARLAASPDSVAGSSTVSFHITTQNAPGPSSNNLPWTPATSQQEINPSLYGMPNSPFPGSPLPPAALPQPQSTDPATLAVDATITSHKLGLGIWLLLAPICLIGLAMWSFSPNPSVAKPKS